MRPDHAFEHSPECSPTPAGDSVAGALLAWFTAHKRALPWRRPGTSAWGILVSEVMSQQTPVSRVAPRWEEWMRRWPCPADLAAAGTDQVLRAWGRLGYPRRALRLKDCAARITENHGGEVPDDLATLLALPGIGDYTARAILAFYFRRRVPVVDTNVRRVYARAWEGRFLAGSPRASTLPAVEALLPAEENSAADVSAALMELGALVCTAAAPACPACPLLPRCEWSLRGRPEPSADEQRRAKARVQRFEGTDRQVRGRIMTLARNHDHVTKKEIAGTSTNPSQVSRALVSLLEDRLLEDAGDGLFRLPA